ncbi:SLC13 family permease [Inquilinus sp. CAU 1745]|uniref:SLC13 family permease n=1 Tax=Inquilinus sp. CAU 1745 TaxID=3140369 RepID=UPI00325BB141
MTVTLDPSIHMWVVLATLVAAMISYAWEKVSVEVTSLCLLGFLIVWFSVFPYEGAEGRPPLDAAELLKGFANPSLIAVLALLVMGQAVVQTGALTKLTRVFVRLSKHHPTLSIGCGLAGVGAVSAWLNNTPVVVMFIPIMQAIAQRLSLSPSRLMMPLSFAAILGGMTTLLGSSTNMLVSSALIDLGETPLNMFDMTAVGVIMAVVGICYVIFILPHILPTRADFAGSLKGDSKQFVAEIDIVTDSALAGQRLTAGHFPALPDVTVKLIQRADQILLPPFGDIELQVEDLLIVVATREALVEAIARNGGYLLSEAESRPDPDGDGNGKPPSERALAEVMITPASRMIDQTLDTIDFHRRFGAQVVGIQRRGRMARRRLGSVQLEAGDVLLVIGARENVEQLANNPDILLMTWAIKDLPKLEKSGQAAFIFGATLLAASTGLVSITVAAFVGATAMVMTGCLNIRQAVRAVDRSILLIVGATLALGAALEATGGATFIANSVLGSIAGNDPALNMTLLFLVVALITNVLSNNACAILFTPIAVSVAATTGVDPMVMAITVLLGANCSFATPIGYQTNLLVMGPGHYRFGDFIRGGLPLTLLMWVVFTIAAPWYFGIGW